MNVTAFRTVRGRLLALIVLVILPIAVITAVTAVATYRSVLSSIEASQLQTVGNFSVRTRLWYRESLRTLLAANASLAAVGATQDNAARQPSGLSRTISGSAASACAWPAASPARRAMMRGSRRMC